MLIDYKVITESSEWKDILNQFNIKDIYYEYEYLNLYKTESEKPMLFFLDSSYGKLAYPFMIRDIAYAKSLLNKIEKQKYFDITSAYGYGGPLVQANSTDCRKLLINEFYEQFQNFCSEKNIISEFIRYNPLISNHIDMKDYIDVVYLRKTIATDLQTYGDPVYGELKKRKRNDASKRRKQGMKTVFELSPKTFDEHLEIYHTTMNRNNASDFYYFKEEYFNNILKTLPENILLVSTMFDEKLIGFELCFIYDKIIHAHISATHEDYLKYSPNDLSTVDIIDWGHKNGYKYYFVGGGTTDKEDDSLYLYKKAFSKNTSFDFYVGKKVFNQDIYEELCSLTDKTKKSEDNDFFPKYRLHI